MKKKVIAFTVFDDNNKAYAEMFENSLRKFHSEEELPLLKITGEDLTRRLAQDPHFFYRQKPLVASELIDEYDLVLGFDCDQIITGDLNHILNDTSYDVGTVLNFNRQDYKDFGPITTYIIDCTRYMNCGLVAMRSKAFIEHWKRLCLSDDIFLNLQYREQDILNILYYFGNYQVKCFDQFDPMSLDEHTWNGLVSYGEWLRAEIKDGKLILPKDKETGYPNTDITLKILHFAHGNVANKMNYRTKFSEPVIEHLDKLVRSKNENRKG